VVRDGCPRDKVAAMHSKRPQYVREQMFPDFRDGKIRFLVSTNLTAYALNIAHLGYII